MEPSTPTTNPGKQRWPKLLAGVLTASLLAAVPALGFTRLGPDLKSLLQSGFGSEDPLTFDAPTATVVKYDTLLADARANQRYQAAVDAAVLENWQATSQPTKGSGLTGPAPPPPPGSGPLTRPAAPPSTVVPPSVPVDLQSLVTQLARPFAFPTPVVPVSKSLPPSSPVTPATLSTILQSLMTQLARPLASPPPPAAPPVTSPVSPSSGSRSAAPSSRPLPPPPPGSARPLPPPPGSAGPSTTPRPLPPPPPPPSRFR
jgi:Wiskott-Aldrich syndrome protein